MKKILSRILASLMIVTAVMLPLCAISYAEPSSPVYVLDNSDVLTDTEEQNFLTYADLFYSSTGWYAAFVTTNDTDSRTSIAYADDIYDELFGINTDGVLFLIDFDTRNFYISTSGEAIEAIDDYEVELILNAAAPYMSDKDYYGAACAAFDKIESLCFDYRDGGSSGSSDVSINLIGLFIIAFFLAVVAFILVVVGVLNAYKNKTAPSADVYAKDSDGFVLNESSDTFVREYTTSVKIETSSSSSDGGGGGSSHTSSSGGSHGGGGRSF